MKKKMVLIWALTGLGLFWFAKLAEDLIYHELYPFDSLVSGWIQGWRQPWLTELMRAITFMGSGKAVIPLSLLALWLLGHSQAGKRAAQLSGAVLIGGVALEESLKRLFHRPRPPRPWLTEASGFSFPSGHAMIGIIAYGLLAYWAWKLLPRPYNRMAAALAVFLFLCIGLSRVYLGVHYPSDVLAGFAAGVFWLGTWWLAVKNFNWLVDGQRKRSV
ncbi:undecaprenyl-diphosphatase [Carboxydocella sporoproducens DSM 16521]|uniref:Undecaprenyl-diphosphatase n=2 Tax=Carboxydocella TaxID=178898 RepID=A0A1T4LB94_9FIRM|nr:MULTISPECIES: phosphatase PAP2 family protein [Carboxydocella]AVX19869.1 undecaprenyl-diphosphatase [Carboxydocella thermautotrophica]AVX30278.1 undecaprenyl-diphosphatase [Carboxydocella thermautotrophica]SJZ51966.1 undecaprenyl-diphosphatase [Carboxydocella sporoproducens DSM 16521]